MRILHVVSNISLGNGIMSVLMSYYRHLDTKKIQFDFLYYEKRPQTYESEIRCLGGETYEISSITHLLKYKKDYKLFCTNNFNKYDIVQIHDYYMLSFMADVKRRLGVKKIIIHSHNTKMSDHFMGKIRNTIFSLPNLFLADKYCACSKEAGKFAFGRKFENGMLINNAIDLDKFSFDSGIRDKIRNELGLENCFVIGNIGGFRPQKNHKFVVDVFNQVLRTNEDARLVLVSDGPLKNDIEKKCKDLNISDKVLFLGTRSDVNDLLCAFDVLLFPSIYEGLGITLIEAQAVGLPCVYSDVIPNITNILNDYNDVLSLRESEEKWAKSVIARKNIRTFLSNEEIHQRIRECGFDIDCEKDKLMDFYESIIE